MKYAGIGFALFLLFSCKTKQPLLMSEAVNTAEKKARLSSFYIPVLLSKTDLEATLNRQIDGPLFDDKITEGSLQITITKVDTIRIELKDSTILYKVPLHILVKKNLFVGDVAAEGDIALNFRTNFNLKEDWSVQTATEIVNYEWIKEPKAKILGFNVPVKSVAERVLDSSKKRVTDLIDQQVKENFALKAYAAQAWTLLQNPILISEEYNSRFKFTPTGLAIAPFQTEKDTIVSTLYVQGSTEVGVGDDIDFHKNTPLLPLQLKSFGRNDKVDIKLVSEIPFKEAEKVALKNFKGETYGFGKKKVVVEDIQLTKDGSVLLIRAKTKGDYTGWLSLKGTPAYNKKKNHIEIQDLEFSLDTKNFLLKSAKWLFNGLLINKLEGSLVYPLEEDLASIKSEIAKQITNYEIQEGVYLKGSIKDLKVNEAFLKESSIMVGVEVKGKVKILIEQLPGG